MQKLTILDTNPDILVSSNIINYDKVDLIYIPIDKNANILVRQNEQVLIGSALIKLDNKIISSPISGKINAIKKVNTLNGLKDAIEICNDFKEKKVIESMTKRSLNHIKKDTFDNILFSNFNIDLKNKKNLILNCIDDEPYVLTENFNLFENYDGFLELLDKITKVYNLENVIVAVKSISSVNINKLMSYLGMYPNISLNIVPDFYLLGTTKFLLNYLNLEESGSVVIKASEFYNIFNLIKRNRQLENKLITISGDGVINPSIVKIKIGTKLIDIINDIIKLKDNVDFIANGLMRGQIIDINNFIITENITSIIIMQKREEFKPCKCINCGACIDICPVNINPILMKNKKYYEKVKDICINCGLCSYICPSNINLNKGLKGDSYE